MKHHFWYYLDTLAHELNRVHLMPRRFGQWICDRFDLSLGVSPEELHSKAGDFHDDFAEINATEDDFDRMWDEGTPT